MLILLLLSAGAILAGGLIALAMGNRFQACLAARLAMCSGAVVGFGVSCVTLWTGEQSVISLPHQLPLGQCIFQVDPLTSLFLLPVFLLSALAALVMPARVRFLEDSIHYGRHCFFFCLLSAGMALVIMAGDGILFLLLWEIMSLAPFFLLSHSDKSALERFAGWIYLVAAHLGALPLLLLFASLTTQAESSSFAAYLAHPEWRHAGLLFLLALIGFGTKSGLFPLHMWMPEAHSSAAGHVAVLLSGTMLNTGLYGIMRIISFFGAGDPWWAYILMTVGAFSGVMGILLGLAQSDMKRTLAYSSAENMGIILLALGAALLAAHNNAPVATSLLLGGVFLHTWNHSLFKSLLFLGANAVKESTHVTTLQRLGGLQKRIPFTGGCFALGSAAIAGIPPFNGFLSELLLYMGFALGADATRGTEHALLFWIAFFILGTIAGLALFAFTRLFGLAFLGTPRTPESLEAREPEKKLRGVMLFLALSCVGICLAGPGLFTLLSPLLQWFGGRLALPLELAVTDLALGKTILTWYALASALLLTAFALLWLAREAIVRKNGSAAAATWGCGYRYPSARMQYTGGSFSLSLALLLRPLLRAKVSTPRPAGFFPAPTKAVMTTPDWPTAMWSSLLFRPVAAFAETTKSLQHGLVNIYILYILLALMAALVWALW